MSRNCLEPDTSGYSTEVYEDDYTEDVRFPRSPIGYHLVVHDRAADDNTEITVTYDEIRDIVEHSGPPLAEVRPFFVSDDGRTVYLMARAGGVLGAPPPPPHIYSLDTSAAPVVDISELEMIHGVGAPAEEDRGRVESGSHDAAVT